MSADCELLRVDKIELCLLLVDVGEVDGGCRTEKEKSCELCVGCRCIRKKGREIGRGSSAKAIDRRARLIRIPGIIKPCVIEARAVEGMG